MEKKLLDHSELMVDTSLLLPFLGIKVRGVNENLLEGKNIYYPSLMLVELIAVVIKEARKLGLGLIPQDAIKGLSYINHTVNLVLMEELDLNVVYDIVSKGWNDIFDAILYSSHSFTKIPLVTLDRMFYEFLNKNSFDTRGIILVTR
ncbi:VapC-type toxin [Sulfolobus acidocaldarius SUSAZ]|nr:VapC-type toxin [Sulfolobus acidocaldarius SUSAZ]